jgi:hypothetical protein
VHVALFVEDLRHADLFTQNSCNCHVFLTSSCDVVLIALPEIHPGVRNQRSGVSLFPQDQTGTTTFGPKSGFLCLVVFGPASSPRPTLSFRFKSGSLESGSDP